MNVRLKPSSLDSTLLVTVTPSLSLCCAPFLPIGSLSLALCIACIKKLLLFHQIPPISLFLPKVLHSLHSTWSTSSLLLTNCHQLRLATRPNCSCRILWPYCDVPTTDVLAAAFNTTKRIRPNERNDALYYPQPMLIRQKAMALPVFLHEWNIAFEMPVDLTSLLAERLQRKHCFGSHFMSNKLSWPIIWDWFKTISHRRIMINKQLREKRARWQLFSPIPGEFMSLSWLDNDLRTCKISFSWDRRVPKSEAPMKKRKMQKTCPSCDCERHQHTLHHSK